MESDDDYDLVSPTEEAPSTLHLSKFKRLKKAVRVSSEKRPQEDQTDSVSAMDSLNGVEIGSSKTLDIGTSMDQTLAASEPDGFDDQRALDSGSDGSSASQDRSEPINAFDAEEGSYLGALLDADTEEFDGKGDEGSTGLGEEIGGEKLLDLNVVKSLKKRRSKGGLEEKKNKKAKSVDDAGKPEASTRNKRGLEKERKARLGALHAESQRLLRETGNASFKPVQLVQKPISSILEKIRQRKLEVSKKACNMNSYDYLADATDCSRESTLGLNAKHVKNDMGEKEGLPTHQMNVKSSLDTVHVDRSSDHMILSGQSEDMLHDVGTATHLSNAEGSLDSDHVSKEGPTPSGKCENTLHNAALDEVSTHAFCPPINDTQDLFCESQPSDGDDEQPMSQSDSPLEEVLVSSVVPMNLKLDSVPDELSDEDEDDNKENVDPYLQKQVAVCLSPKGDPVKAFVDEEAEVEDDSDNDLMRFQENEEDWENEDEDLNDIIVRGYRERPVDSDMRNQLHQKWLEQQDATETDSVLQRLKGGWKQRDPIMFEDEEEDKEYGEDSLDGAPDDLLPSTVAKANSKKLKQMIPQMFTDKDDVFLSSDDEEAEQSLQKLRLLEKIEDQALLLSPAEDESSREVLGLIKKLNIAPEIKKKQKTSSFFDMLITGGNSNNSSKSSFLGRAPSNSSSSSRKHGSSTTRSFIFGRDDSNSRSGISTSEVSLDVGLKEKRSTTNASAKYSGSQSKSSRQNAKTVIETVSGSLLFEILRHSSKQSDHCSKNNMVGQTQTVFAAFKSGKKAIKIEGRT